jgi:hypothetical protein
MAKSRATREQLYQDYIVDRLLMRDIAAKYGYGSEKQACRAIHRRGIPVREGVGTGALPRPHKKPGAVLEGDVWQVVCGTMLGDGYLARNGRHAYLTASHKIGHRAYVDWLCERLGDWVSGVYRTKPHISQTVRAASETLMLQTITHPEFLRLRSVFYRDGKKRIPGDILNSLGPLAFGVLVMDDGCHGGGDCIHIASQGFPIEDQELLRDWMRSLGMDSTFNRCDGGAGQFIRLGKASTAIARDMLLPIIPESMRYKIGC